MDRRTVKTLSTLVIVAAAAVSIVLVLEAFNVSAFAFGIGKAVVGIVLLRVVDEYLFPGIDFIEEVRNANVAAGLVYAALCVLLAAAIGTI